jgi:hypothetical protein
MKAVYAVLTGAAFVTSANAGNNFERVPGITDGSPYALIADEGAAGRRGAEKSNDADAWFELQRRISDGYAG